MKKNDIAIIVAVAGFAGIFSLVISQLLFGGQKSTLTAEVVDPISAEFQKPDPNVFNDQAINPTQLIQIGDGSNKNPF
jgi:hypothetical protein